MQSKRHHHLRSILPTTQSPTNCHPEQPAPSLGPIQGDVEAAMMSPDFIGQLTRVIAGWRVDAEETLSITLLRLVQAARDDRYDPARGTPLRLAIGIARRVQLERLRRARRDAALLEMLRYRADSVRDPSEDAVAGEELDLLRRKLAQLPLADQELLRRRYGPYHLAEERSPMSAADRTRLSRLISKLRT